MHAVSPDNPEDWPHVFERHLNAGDLEAVVSLYDARARFVAPSGEVIAGRDLIRPVLAALIETKTRLHGEIVRAVTVGDVALLYTDFQGTTVDAAGATVAIRSKAIELLRRQADGTWKLVVGDPNGRG